MFLIGVDIGTSSCKLTVFDVEGNIMFQDSREYSITTPYKGWIELNPKQVWEAFSQTLIIVLNKFKGQHIDYAMSFSVLGDALILISENREILYPAILSSDVRSRKYINKINENFDREELFHKCGRIPHSMTVLSKLVWLRENRKDKFSRARYFLDFQSWLLMKLGFAPTTDFSSAAGTLFFDIHNKEYYREVLDWINLSPQRLPELKQAGTYLGTVGPEAFNITEFGSGTEISIVLGAMDQICNSLGTGTVESADLVCSTGTVECTTAILPANISSEKLYETKLVKAPGAFPEEYVLHTLLWTAGGLLRWFRDNFAGREVEIASKKGVNPYELLVGDRVKPSDSFVLPYWAGSGTPFWNDTSKGAIMGLDLFVDKSDIVDGILEGITFELKYNLECLEEIGLSIDSLSVIGGGSKSAKWMQLKADILNLKTVNLTYDECGCLGAALLAGYGIKEFKSLRETSKRFVEKEEEYIPDPVRVEQYKTKYRYYRQVYPHLERINSIINDYYEENAEN